MAVVVGQCQTDPVTGAAGRCYAEMLANGLISSPSPALRASIAKFIEAMVTGLLNEITINARTGTDNETIT